MHVQGRCDVVVYLNPADLAVCQASLGGAAQIEGVKLAADEVVQRGQCLVETSQGAMVSSFLDRMDDLADAIRSQG